jgi:hypothetical protein
LEAAIRRPVTGCSRAVLITNSELLPALQLYESVGFQRIKGITDGRFVRGDLEMMLRL